MCVLALTPTTLGAVEVGELRGFPASPCWCAHPIRSPRQAADICDEVAAAGTACIASKGSFSLCIPGGSVVAALAKMPEDAFDFTKMHVFFANEKIPSYPCLNGALEITKALGVPEDQASQAL
jgi:hypothetical protein